MSKPHVSVLQVFPNKSLSKLKDCITVRDRLLTRKLEEHKVLYRPLVPVHSWQSLVIVL